MEYLENPYFVQSTNSITLSSFFLGKEGLCITLVTEFDVRRLRMIEEHIRK